MDQCNAFKLYKSTYLHKHFKLQWYCNFIIHAYISDLLLCNSIKITFLNQYTTNHIDLHQYIFLIIQPITEEISESGKIQIT